MRRRTGGKKAGRRGRRGAVAVKALDFLNSESAAVYARFVYNAAKIFGEVGGRAEVEAGATNGTAVRDIVAGG